MIGTAETAWLFTRGPQSVRIVRLGQPDGPVRLLVLGPGPGYTSYDSPDATDCVTYQSQVERTLVAEGYQLERLAAAERRAGFERRQHSRSNDRRRTLELAV